MSSVTTSVILALIRLLQITTTSRQLRSILNSSINNNNQNAHEKIKNNQINNKKKQKNKINAFNPKRSSTATTRQPSQL